MLYSHFSPPLEKDPTAAGISQVNEMMPLLPPYPIAKTPFQMIAKVDLPGWICPAEMTCSAVHEGRRKVVGFKFHEWHVNVWL
jgi:hypothetical protein